MGTYTTIQGDTWDMIAKKVYGSESYITLLLKSNMPLIDYLVFPEGITVYLPDKPEEADGLPEWRD